MSAVKRSSDLGAGLSLSKPTTDAHPSGPVQHGAFGQAERAFSAASTFLSGVLAISASQFIGAPLKLVDPKFYDQYMAWTKESFAVLVSTMTQLWAPTAVRVTGDESMREQLFQMPDGSLRCNFPHRLVMMANHQLYTDWLYLWWTAYTNKMHGRIYIILKESLKNVPIFGWSAQFYNFIFLARKWETDKPRFRRHLRQLSNPLDPMWLLIFPEGTNLSANTREKSKAWAAKTGIPDMKHQLLPRSTGLQFCLQELVESTNWLYDCTIAYEGVPEGMFGQDIFTLRSSLFEGRPPKSVNMYWRRWRITDLPIDDPDKFSKWLLERWAEKDYLLEHFYRHKTFPEGDVAKAMKAETALKKFAIQQKESGNKQAVKMNVKSAKFIETEVKAGGMEEFMGMFQPIATAASAVSSGQLNPENIDFEALMMKVAAQQKQAVMSGKGVDLGPLAGLMGSSLVPPGTTSRAAKVSQIEAPRPSAAAIRSPTEGKVLDPEIRNLIENAHRKTQERLLKAGTPTTKKAPNVRQSIPMVPTRTLATRPITSIAVQRGTSALAKMAPKVGQGRQAAESKASAALKGTSPAKKATTNGTAARPALQRRGSAQSSSTSSSSRPAAVKQTMSTAAPKTQPNGSTKSGKAPHPLAGKTISRAAFEGRMPQGQQQIPKSS